MHSEKEDKKPKEPDLLPYKECRLFYAFKRLSQEIYIRVYEILYQLYGYVHVPIGLGSNCKINKKKSG